MALFALNKFKSGDFRPLLAKVSGVGHIGRDGEVAEWLKATVC